MRTSITVLSIVLVTSWTVTQGRTAVRIEDDVLVAVPAGAVLVVHATDISEMREKAAANSWFRIWTDPRMAEFVTTITDGGLDIYGDFADIGLPPLDELLGAIDSVAGFIVGSEGDAFAAGGAVFRMTEDGSAAEKAFDVLLEVVDAESSRTTETRGGTEISVFEGDESLEPNPLPFTLTYRRGDVLAVFLAPTRELGVEMAAGTLERLAASTADGGMRGSTALAEARKTNPDGHAQLEVFFDVAAVLEASPRDELGDDLERHLWRALDTVPWIYCGATIGAGEAIDLQATIPFGEESVFADFCSLGRPISPELFQLIPPRAVTASAGSIDWQNLVETVLDYFSEYWPDEYEMFEQGLLQAEEMLGIHPFDDLLFLLDGDFATFQMPFEEEAEKLGEEYFEMYEDSSLGSGIIVGLSDSEGFADSLEAVLDASGMGAMLELDDFEGHDVYTIPIELGMTMSWAVADDFIVFGLVPEYLHHVLRAAKDDEIPSFGDDEHVAAAVEAASGSCSVSILSTPRMISSMLWFFEMMVAFETDGMVELGVEGLAAVVEEYFQGMMVGVVEMDETHFQLRLTAR